MSTRTRFFSVVAAGVAAMLIWTAFGSIQIASGQEAQTIIARAHDGTHGPSFTKPIYVLVVGGDARQGNPQHVRIDSIHILAIDPVSLKGSLVGIPRDSYVPIPGHGTDKINAAGYFGGPELMMQTVENISGCTFDYYMLTSFVGFVRLVDDFGGVTFDVDRGAHGNGYHEKGSSKINLNPGRQRLTGEQSLAWSRFRHDRPRGDFDRSFAQGQLAVAALAEARKDYKAKPGTALRNLGAMLKNIKTTVPLAEALKLGLLALRMNPENVKNIVLDGGSANVNGASVVKLSGSATDQMHDACDDGILQNH